MLDEIFHASILGHNMDYHHRMIKKNSQIKMPFQLGWVSYPDDKLEYEFCNFKINIKKGKKIYEL